MNDKLFLRVLTLLHAIVRFKLRILIKLERHVSSHLNALGNFNLKVSMK